MWFKRKTYVAVQRVSVVRASGPHVRFLCFLLPGPLCSSTATSLGNERIKPRGRPGLAWEDTAEGWGVGDTPPAGRPQQCSLSAAHAAGPGDKETIMRCTRVVRSLGPCNTRHFGALHLSRCAADTSLQRTRRLGNGINFLKLNVMSKSHLRISCWDGRRDAVWSWLS